MKSIPLQIFPPKKPRSEKAGSVIGRGTHVFLFDEHYALAGSHWQTLGHNACKRSLPVLEALKCAPPTKANREDNAIYKSLIGALLRCPGPGCCADPLLFRQAFFQTGARTYSVHKQWLARRSEIKYLVNEVKRKENAAKRTPHITHSLSTSVKQTTRMGTSQRQIHTARRTRTLALCARHLRTQQQMVHTMAHHHAAGHSIPQSSIHR